MLDLRRQRTDDRMHETLGAMRAQGDVPHGGATDVEPVGEPLLAPRVEKAMAREVAVPFRGGAETVPRRRPESTRAGGP